ncbi:GntR family transcriptional regulator [Alsobacter sp. R-9]
MSVAESSKSRQVYLVLRDRIASGAYAGTAALPTEQALAAEHAVSRMTVRRALAALEDEGLISRRQGSGTFLADARPRPIVADLSDALANLVAMGRTTTVRLLSFGYEEPTPAVAEGLGLEPGERVQRSVRVRFIDEAPFSFLTTFVPERIGRTYSEADLASRPLLSLLERSGIVVQRATQEIGAQLASPEVAEALGVEVGSALTALTRVVHDGRGHGVEYLSALYRPDRYVFRMDLVRTQDRNGRRWSPAAGAVATPKSAGTRRTIETDARGTRAARQGRGS